MRIEAMMKQQNTEARIEIALPAAVAARLADHAALLELEPHTYLRALLTEAAQEDMASVLALVAADAPERQGEPVAYVVRTARTPNDDNRATIHAAGDGRVVITRPERRMA